MFDYDEIEEVSPAAAAAAAAPKAAEEPLYSAPGRGETPGPPGFAQRAEDDPLRRLFPLRHLVLLEEWLPPGPPGIERLARRAGSRQPQRKVLCVGPPSARAADWAAADAFGGQGTEGTGNALVQLANRSRDELYVFEYADTDKATMTLDTVAKKLALAISEHPGPWVGVGVSVGAWVLAATIEALPGVGPQGAAAARRCERLHAIGFPPPGAGLDFPRPQGAEDADWQLAGTLRGARQFAVPNGLSVYHFVKDTAISRDQTFSWFKLQSSLKDGSTKGAYSFYGLQGDHGTLKQPRCRTELYWALANSSWGSGPPLFDAAPPYGNKEAMASWWEAMPKIGHGPARRDGIFDEATDVILRELEASPSLKRFANLQGMPPAWSPSENFCGGNAGARAGLDIRMYVDTDAPKTGAPVGCRTAAAVRFGGPAGISAFPGLSTGVHGGAIQAAMDEVTAICCRVWVAPGSTTRKISHQISRPAYQFQTYKALCEITSLKHEGALVITKARLTDLLGETICITTSELVDFEKMAFLQNS